MKEQPWGWGVELMREKLEKGLLCFVCGERQRLWVQCISEAEGATTMPHLWQALVSML